LLASQRPIVERMPLKPGDKAPDFTLLDQDAKPVTLSKSVKAKNAPHLIYFYPGA
jgi:peroxiredoxin